MMKLLLGLGILYLFLKAHFLLAGILIGGILLLIFLGILWKLILLPFKIIFYPFRLLFRILF